MFVTLQVLVQKLLNFKVSVTETVTQLEAGGNDPKSGYGSLIWDSWQTTWTGEDETVDSETAWVGNELIRTDTVSKPKRNKNPNWY